MIIYRYRMAYALFKAMYRLRLIHVSLRERSRWRKALRGGVKREALFLEANKLYYGELLPANQTDGWFFQRSNYYKNLFLKTVAELEKIYFQKKDTARRIGLYSKAALIYPYENWQIKQIACSLEMYRHEEALKIYQDTMELYAREIGSEPPKELLQCFEEMEPAWESHRNNMETPYGWKKLDKAFLEKRDILHKAFIPEDKPNGAYYCTYPSFVDYCHLVTRAMARNEMDAVLMFLTLSRNGKNTFRKEINLQEEMDKLKEAIGKSLRIGDAYTRYGNRHFILMLMGTTMEFCGAIFQRIEKAYQLTGKEELWYYADMTQKLTL